MSLRFGALPLLLAALGVAACVAEASVGVLELERGPEGPEEEKRLGFNGMRGKKDELADDDGLDKRSRNTLGFSGMRGKKSDDPEQDADDALEKRARNALGFSGMRGKKDDFEDGVLAAAAAADGGFDKRARNTLGFSGMRGKKAAAASSDEFVMEDLVDKRAGGGRSALGFSGMRGKKDLDDVEAFLAKRAKGGAGFVGMRGRRENGQAFFGMRGKRPQGDVPGGADEDAVFGYLQSPEAAREGVVTYRSKRYLPSHWQLRNSKKTPFSGFIGLRGKKNFAPAAASFFESELAQ